MPFYFEPTLSDAWLSGFTDAEGTFLCTVSKRKDTKRKLPFALRLRYILSQKDCDAELKYITTLIGGSVELTKSKLKVSRLAVYILSLDKIVDYLNKYPLRTQKLESFKKWIEIRKIVQAKEHLSITSMLAIKAKSREINRPKNTNLIEENDF